MKVERTIQDNCQPKLVAIIGGSGAGKSYLASLLQEAFDADATRLAIDNFYRDRSASNPAARARINFDHPRALDWAELESTLKNLTEGRPAYIPQYDFATHTRHAVRTLVEPRSLIFVEGLWPCHKKSVRRLFDYRIFLDCPAPTRLERRVDRDTRERGRTAESVRRQFFATVAPMHDQFVTPQIRYSDLVVRKTLAARDVARLARTIQQLSNTKGNI